MTIKDKKTITVSSVAPSKDIVKKDARGYNIEAIRIIAESVKSSIGPTGATKLISKNEDLTITGNGFKILSELTVKHPAVKILQSAIRAAQREVGDGTKSIILITSELLQQAQKLMSKGIPPARICSGYEIAFQKVIQLLNQIALQVRNTHLVLEDVAKTSMNGKLPVLNINHHAKIVREVILHIQEKRIDKCHVDLEYVKILGGYGGCLDDTRLITGIAIDKEVILSTMPKRIENARIAVIACPIEIENPISDGVERRCIVTKPAMMRVFHEEKFDMLKDMVKKIGSSGANVVFHQTGVRSIDENVQQYLAGEGIMAVRFVSEEDIRKIAKATNASIVFNLRELTPNDLGYAKLVEERIVGDKYGKSKYVFVEDCKNPKSVTIFIRGVGNLTADAEDIFKNALNCARQVVEEPYVVAAGGAAEVEVARRLRKWSCNMMEKRQLAIEAFAEALESIPRVLIENAGLDPLDTLSRIRRLHYNGEQNAGFDSYEGVVNDTTETGILQPLSTKRQTITSAFETANTILRIDEIIELAPTGIPKKIQPCPPYEERSKWLKWIKKHASRRGGF